MTFATKLGPVELVPIRASQLKPGFVMWHNGTCGVVKKVHRQSDSGTLLVAREDAPRLICVDEFEVFVERRRREPIVRGEK